MSTAAMGAVLSTSKDALMALPPAAPERQLKHRRSIEVQVFARGGGLWEVDATVRDTKTRDVQLAVDMCRAGQPIHSMLLRLVVDQEFNIVEAGSQTIAMPFPGHCEQHGDAYSRLVGLNLMNGFRQAVRTRLGGVLGCTHLTELTQVLPTAVAQGFVGEFARHSDPNEQPYQLDRCHALRTDSQAVRTYYPRWYKPASTSSATIDSSAIP